MPAVSPLRLHALRATYLLIVVGLGVQIWPLLLRPSGDVELMRGVVRSVLAAVSLLAIVGIRHPLPMLPLLLFELAWKTVWVAAVGLPLWSAGPLDPATAETLRACLMGVILFPLVIPWRHVRARFIAPPPVPA